MSRINVALAGLGNCAGSLIEGLAFYRQNPHTDHGLLFSSLCGYSVRDIHMVAAFDISREKVGLPLREAIYKPPNNFVRLPSVTVETDARVFRGPTLDGNPDHLARFVGESPRSPNDVAGILKDAGADILLNLLPTGSIAASEFYAKVASDAHCAFINCIPTPICQKPEFQALYYERRLPLFGDDIKSQVGTTILHRSLLHMLETRGARLAWTSQVNMGGNTDFANFVHRAETKLVSKRKSLARYTNGIESHVGHHYDPTKGPMKHALIELEAHVFAGSPVKISVRLESDDKPNSAGSIVDLIRLAKGARDRGIGGAVPEVCAYYMKSPPQQMDDLQAYAYLKDHWAC
jgi:myo-inositol-1-phosphate synthase